MPIPDFNHDGLLPPGIYDVTVDEIAERLGCFQQSDQRVRLFAKLRTFLSEALSTDLVTAVIVDGSFVTSKQEPSDIDLVLALRRDHDFAQELRPFEYNIVSRRRVRKAYRFDIIVAREGSVEYDRFTGFFQQVKGEPSVRKGILRVRK